MMRWLHRRFHGGIQVAEWPGGQLPVLRRDITERYEFCSCNKLWTTYWIGKIRVGFLLWTLNDFYGIAIIYGKPFLKAITTRINPRFRVERSR